MKKIAGSALLSVVMLLSVVTLISVWQLQAYQQFARQYREQIQTNTERLHDLMREKNQK